MLQPFIPLLHDILPSSVGPCFLTIFRKQLRDPPTVLGIHDSFRSDFLHQIFHDGHPLPLLHLLLFCQLLLLALQTLQRVDPTDSFSAPSGFFASASTILISSTQSSGFLTQESPITDTFTQFASLRDSLVLAADYLVVLMAVHELLCVVARPHPSWSLRAALVQSRSHVHLPSILWIHVVCWDCSALLNTAQIPAETVVA